MWFLKLAVGFVLSGCILGVMLAVLSVPYYLYETIQLEKAANDNVLIYGD